MGDLFKRSAISGEWTFVAGSTAAYAARTAEQGVGVPIAGNFSGPGSRVQPAWSVRIHRRSTGSSAMPDGDAQGTDRRRLTAMLISRSVCFSFSLCWAFFPCCVFSSVVTLFLCRVQRLEQWQAVRLRRRGHRNSQRPVRPHNPHAAAVQQRGSTTVTMADQLQWGAARQHGQRDGRSTVLILSPPCVGPFSFVFSGGATTLFRMSGPGSTATDR